MLENLKMLENLSLEDKKQLGFFCQERTLSKGDILFEEGDDASAMYFLTKGSIEIIKNIKGKQVLLGNVFAEEIIGEMALFGKTGKRMGTARALEDCELLVVAYFSIEELTKKNPLLLGKIQKVIEDRNAKNKILEDKVINN